MIYSNCDSERFWKYVSKASDSECWLWTGATSKSSSSTKHGKWCSGKNNTLSCNANRAAWELIYGEIPKGKRIKHTCTSYLCCNPLHLKLSDDIEERFWSKVDKKSESECWLWKARITNGGYGQFRLDPKKPHVPAHRVAWQLANNQDIPEGMVICHKCDTRACVNPSHLFIGTTKDNIQDMISKGRQNFYKLPLMKGKNNPNASDMTVEQVLAIKKMFDDGATYQQVIDKYSISKGTAYNIKSGKHWLLIDN